MGLTRLKKSRCQQASVPFAGSGGECFLAFPSLWRLPTFFGLMAPSSFKASTGRLCLSSDNHSDTDSSAPSLPSFKDPRDYIGPTWIMQANLTLRSTD